MKNSEYLAVKFERKKKEKKYEGKEGGQGEGEQGGGGVGKSWMNENTREKSLLTLLSNKRATAGERCQGFSLTLLSDFNLSKGLSEVKGLKWGLSREW